MRKEVAVGWLFIGLAMLVAIPMFIPVLLVKGYGIATDTFNHFAQKAARSY